MSILEKLFEFDNKGWNINCQQLPTPERGVIPYHYIHDKLIESPEKKYACFFYTINEYRMGSEAGLIAVYKNKNNPKLIANPKEQWFNYQGLSSITFFDDILFLRKLAYNIEEHLSGTPFVVFDLVKKTFGFIDFDWSSVYYSPVKISQTIFKFCYDKQGTNSKFNPSRHNEIFDLTTIKYYDMDYVNDLLMLYFKEKTAI